MKIWFSNNQSDILGAKIKIISPVIREHITEILREVLKSEWSFCSSPFNSDVYFTTPELIAPLAKVNTIEIKLEKAPKRATPDGPVKTDTILVAIKPEAIRKIVIIAENILVFINFKMIY